MNSMERELKLVPRDVALLDRLADMNAVGPFAVVRRSEENQRNSFFDTSSRSLEKAQVGFRRRVVSDRQLAAWTIKGQGGVVRGVVSRPEIELELDADMAPALALDALQQSARSRGAPLLAEQISDALASGGLPQQEPVLETETYRRMLDLAAADRGWAVELALDRVRLLGHRYAETEIEVELKRGEEDSLDAARAAISELGDVTESKGSKLSRALAHLRDCHCSA
jgi:inorganic triphosphatase YgiF